MLHENPTAYTYDLNGNNETVTYASTAVTRTTYDAEDRKATVTEAQGTAVARTREIVSRDRNGNPTEEQDFNLNSTLYAYNPLNLVASITDAAGNATVKTYYGTGKLKSEQNRRGHVKCGDLTPLRPPLRPLRFAMRLCCGPVVVYDQLVMLASFTSKD